MPVGLGAIPMDPSLEDGGASLRSLLLLIFSFEPRCCLSTSANKSKKSLYELCQNVDKSLQQLTGHVHAKRDLFSSCCECNLTLAGVRAQLARCDQL